jgi:uncharacterized damage-inducible protein DinB|tara:strand:+ start:1254 stop:1790 length:537 start_codon:yes stop_codon:yes gene_type:complete
LRTNNLVLKYIELSEIKNRILNNLVDYTAEELNFKPSENEWSISQVVEHLIESEAGVNKYINFKLKNIEEQPKAGIRSFLNSKVLNKKLKSNEKFKVPTVLSEPELGNDYSDLKEKWDNSRMFLIKTVETFPKGKIKKAIFNHPVAGLLNMHQTMLFLINHLDHHIPQIDALRIKLAD